jgi:hypothetical protein
MHLHVRRPKRYRLPTFQPTIYPRLLEVNAHTRGANLRFRNPDLARRMNRTFGKNRSA